MSARAIFRSVMVVVAVVVVAVVWALWEGRPDTPDSGGGSAGPPAGVVSETRAPTLTSIANGVNLYDLRADHRVRKFRDIEGEQREVEEFSGDVSLVIYRPAEDEGGPAEDEGGLTETTRLTAHTLIAVPRQVPVEGEEFESIELLAEEGDDTVPRVVVTAVLPSGVTFTSERLRYRDGRLLTDQGVLLSAGGLVIESRSLRYDPDTGVVRLSREHPSSRHAELGGAVRLWSAEADAQGAALGMQGSSGEILYDADGAELMMRASPVLRLPDAELSGAQVVMGLDEAATEIRSITVSGGARAVWLAASSPGEHAVSGDLIVVDVPDGEANALRVTSAPDSPRPRFDLGDAGTLRADIFELALGGSGVASSPACEGAAAALVACGQAYFFPATPDSGLVHIRADVLAAGSAGAEQLDAAGNVEIAVAGDDEDPLMFRGPTAQLVYRDGALESADWPAGVRYSGAGREVSAGHGAYQPGAGDWLLDGAPRPSFLSEEFDVESDQIWLRGTGGVDLVGNVDASLRGDVVETLGPLFGNAPQIEAAAESLHVATSGALAFEENASIWEGDGARLLRADTIEIIPGATDVQARGNVFASLANPRADPADPSVPADVLLTGNQMVIYQESGALQLRLAGAATIQTEGDSGRTIGGNLLIIRFLEDGGWESMEVRTQVVMSDPAGTGRGERLEYDAETGQVVIYAGPIVPATFVTEDGAEIRDRESLELLWDGDSLRIDATQSGSTQTVRSRQR